MNSGGRITVVSCREANIDDWLPLRQALWPRAAAAEHHREIETMLSNAFDATAFIALDAGTAAGFSEVSLPLGDAESPVL